MKNVITTALAALIVFSCAAFCAVFYAACGTGGKRNAGVFLDGKWSNTSENDTSSFLLDGNNWIYYNGNKPVSKGTWDVSVTPAEGGSGTITFTVTQVDMGKGWINLDTKYNKIKTCTVKYSIDPDGKRFILSDKKLAAADPEGLWSKLEGAYIKGGGRSGGGVGRSGTGNAGASGKAAADGSASQAAKRLSATTADSTFISYIITGSGTSFTAKKNGAPVGTANRTINDVIDAIKTDAGGANVAIQFGDGTSVLDIGAASARFGFNSGDIWGGIALSGKITSSASPAIDINSVFITSIADISTSRAPADGNAGGAAIDNGGTLIINGGTVTTNAVNNYGIRNRGGRVIINGGNVSPKGEGIYNDSVSGKGGTITINGGTVQSISGRAINNKDGCTLTITGGTVTSFSSETIYNPGGTVKIGGGTVTGGISGHAILNTGGGTVTITGGTVSTVNAKGNYAAISNAGGGTVTIASPPAVIIGNVSGNGVTSNGVTSNGVSLTKEL